MGGRKGEWPGRESDPKCRYSVEEIRSESGDWGGRYHLRHRFVKQQVKMVIIHLYVTAVCVRNGGSLAKGSPVRLCGNHWCFQP